MTEKIIELIENNKFHKVFDLINKNKQLIDQELNNNYRFDRVNHQPICAALLRQNHLAGGTAFDPGEYTEIAV